MVGASGRSAILR